ncbi:hypothetical protein Tco_0991022 [Tanacetum coccineum]|uniref:Uncharacterized protein n=1 Tax=Tanacetum coccineum TaxID=301880 RepID=A0ABQ5EYV7_9ASTR
MISGRSLLLCVRIVMTSRLQTRISSNPRLELTNWVIKSQVIENQNQASFSYCVISSDLSMRDVGSRPLGLFFLEIFLLLFTYDLVVAPETFYFALFISSAAPVVETTLVASPTRLSISPFLCTDSSEAPDSSDGPLSQDPYVATITRWRSRFIYDSAASVHSSGLDASDQAHSGSSTRDVPPRLCYPPRRAPRRSEAFHHWCAAPLSTLYPPTTSESSLGDSSERPLHSSSYSARPSRKRAIEEDTEIDPIKTKVDMELGIGDGDDVRDHIKIDPRDVRDDTEEYEANTSAGDTVEVGIDPMSAPIVEEEIVEPAGEDSSDSSGTRDGIVRSFEDMPIDLDDVVHDFYHHMSEVRIDRIVGIETVQRRLEADQLIARGQRVSMIERIDSLRLENLKVRAMLDIERDRVNSLRLHMSLSQEEFRQVRRDRDDTRGRLRRLESYVERRLGFCP